MTDLPIYPQMPDSAHPRSFAEIYATVARLNGREKE